MKDSQLNRYELRPINKLKAYKNNPRKHSDPQVDEIAKSIEVYGFTNPVLIKPDGELIAGHGRLMAAQRLGIKQVPCLVLEGLTEDQCRALVIADNKIALNATWDESLLVQELQSLNLADLPVGFSAEELAALLSDREFEDDDENGDDGSSDEPRKTDDEYGAFEVVMLYENKLRLIRVLNDIKTEHDIESNEDALMIMVAEYER